jgi:hypothetical protein
MKDVPKTVLLLVMVGMIAGVGLTIMDTFSDSLQTTTAAMVNNEVATMANNSAVYLTYSAGQRYGGGLAVVQIRNNSAAPNNAILDSSNYTVVQSPDGSVRLAAGGGPVTDWNGASVKVNYTYNQNDNTAGYQALENFSVSTTNFTSMFPTIGTILGVSVLIIAMLGAFYFSMGRIGGGRASSSASR